MGIFGISKKEKERINYLLNVGMQSIEKSEYFEASRIFSEILKLDPKNPKALYYMGRSLAGEEKYNQAIEYFDKAIQINPDDETWYWKGHALILSGKYSEETLNSFKKAYELNPDDSAIIGSISDCYAKMGEFNNAKMYLDHYLSKHPDDAWVWGKKGEILEQLEDYQNALECYSNAESHWNNEIYEVGFDEIYWAGYVRVCNKLLLKEDFNNILPLGKSESIIDQCLCSIVSDCHFLRFDVDTLTENLDDYDEDLCPFILHHEIGDLIIVLTTENLYFIYNGDPTIENIEWEPVEKFRVSWEREWNTGRYDILAICMDNDVFAFENTKKSHQFANSLSEAVSNKRVKNKLQPPKNTSTIIDFSSIKEYLKNGGVVMQTFKCPGCGAALEFPDNVDTTTCQYCGNKIKAVDLFEKIRNLV